MHVLSVQSILPARWLEWYAPGGVPDMSGLKVHAFSFPRFAFFFAAAAAGTGIFLLAYADYFRARGDFPAPDRELCRRIGWQRARWGFLGQALLAVAWFAGVEKAAAHPFLWITLVTLLAFLILLWQAGKEEGPRLAGKTVARLSNSALAIVLSWVAIFFGLGITVWVRNFWK